MALPLEDYEAHRILGGLIFSGEDLLLTRSPKQCQASNITSAPSLVLDSLLRGSSGGGPHFSAAGFSNNDFSGKQ